MPPATIPEELLVGSLASSRRPTASRPRMPARYVTQHAAVQAMARAATLVDVSEYLTTETCSDCGAVGGPKGTKGLEVREWTCMSCGVVHDRRDCCTKHSPPGTSGALHPWRASASLERTSRCNATTVRVTIHNGTAIHMQSSGLLWLICRRSNGCIQGASKVAVSLRREVGIQVPSLGFDKVRKFAWAARLYATGIG